MITFVVRRVAPLIVVAVPLAVLTWSPTGQIASNDTFFHLRFGAEYLSGSWSLWHPGTPSSFSTADWTPTQWLPQLTMAWAESWGGLAAVVWLIRVLTLGLAAVLLGVARWRADPLAAAGVTVLAIVALAPALSARPQVVSYLLMAVVVHQWLRAAERGRPPWLLIPLTWLWAMCHGMWPLAIGFGVVTIAGMALDRQLGRATWWRFALVPVLSGLAAAATPIGPAIYPAVLAVTSRTSGVAEWGPPQFTEPYGLALLGLGSLALLHMLRRTNPWLEILMVGFALGLGLYSIRTVPIAAVILVPFAARGLQSLIGPSSPRPRWETPVVAGLVAAGATLFAISALVVPTQARPVPAWLDDRLAALEPGTPILNQTGWDGYLMWRHPHLDPMIHAYVQTYRADELEQVHAVLRLQPEGFEHVADSGVTHALLAPENPLSHALVKDGWTRAETSEDLVLLLAPGAGR